MRHFGYLSASETDALFEAPPERFDRDSGTALLSVALGATLYMPASRASLAADVTKQAAAGVTSVVVCLEDAVADEDLVEAEANLVAAFTELHLHATELPLLFVRVRAPAQIPALVARLGPAAAVLDGVVLPKFTAACGAAYLRAVAEADAIRAERGDGTRGTGPVLRVMPVIESGAVLYAESRVEELTLLRALLNRERHRVLAIRIGATDLSALYGLRRSPDLSIYDVKVVSNLIADVVNVLGRADGTGFTVTGPVWEYYGGPGGGPERIFKPLLRQSPFVEHDEPDLRGHLVSRAIDGLIREVTLDRANGLTGKTAIHPSHVAVVNALSVVSYEEHRDAADVLGSGRAGGVLPSVRGNKMNEVRPHTAWARRTMLRSRVFGIAADGVSFVDLLAASLPR